MEIWVCSLNWKTVCFLKSSSEKKLNGVHFRIVHFLKYCKQENWMVLTLNEQNSFANSQPRREINIGKIK